MKRVIGIDQSKAQTGVCRIDYMASNGTPILETSKFKVKAVGTAETIEAWYRYLREYLETGTRPHLLVYELPVIANMGNMILYQLSGVLIHACVDRDISVIGVHNQTLKKWAGCGPREKPNEYATSLTGIEKMTSDEADAIVLAEIALYVANEDLDPGSDHKRAIVSTLRMTEQQKRDAKEEALLTAAKKRVERNEAAQRKSEARSRRASKVKEIV